MMIDNNYFKNKLEAEKKILQAELDEIGVAKKDDPNDWAVSPIDRDQEVTFKDDMADRMEDIQGQEAAEIPLEGRYREVIYALQKIAEGRYGICEVSGEEIETDRLKANPAARTCKQHLDQESKLPPINL